MKHRYNIAISLALVFLLLLAPSFGLVAAIADGGLHQMVWAPAKIFEADWYGTLLKTEGSIQFWQLELVPTKMMGAGMIMDKWVEMTIMWDTLAQNGQVIALEHFGMNLHFTGWGGTIWYTPGYHFWIGGLGVGTYNSSGTLYPCTISGMFEGNYTPLNPTTPFVEGYCGYSEFTERALLTYGTQPVGGEVVPVDKLALLAPWMVVAVAAITIGFTISKRRLYLH
jgi:hypothetical protein